MIMETTILLFINGNNINDGYNNADQVYLDFRIFT